MVGSCKQCVLNYTEGIRYQARHLGSAPAQSNIDSGGFVVFIEYSSRADSSSHQGHQVSLEPDD